MPEPAADAIRQAASTLIAAAPAGAVLAAMRAMLADWPDTRSAAAVTPPRAVRSNGGAPAPTPPADEVRAPQGCSGPQATAAVERDRWDQLRQEVRAALTRRGIAVPALADQLGLAVTTVRTSLQTRSPPSRALQQRLTKWLAAEEGAAPEVAAPGPFRSNGTGAGNGSAGADHAAA
jgi:hypothetical protein